MKIGNIGDIVNLIAAGGVIISLLFVAYELNQNTDEARSANHHMGRSPPQQPTAWSVFTVSLEPQGVIELQREIREIRMEAIVPVQVLQVVVKYQKQLTPGLGYPVKSAVDAHYF